jgi:hypothetical protein
MHRLCKRLLHRLLPTHALSQSRHAPAQGCDCRPQPVSAVSCATQRCLLVNRQSLVLREEQQYSRLRLQHLPLQVDCVRTSATQEIRARASSAGRTAGRTAGRPIRTTGRSS